ncbi:hypothetical protein PSET11_01441 [Arthrobacter ulcerisalmonis]|uniref:NPCBM/NEW2 domain protein n=1 Tax=Arthrobacter ulcerisalmonis TaxID=2483813 RepID=A0A3P5X0N7_9MICC|nr:hypothetical protein [Arthrobacter ulcerisalmonis]VDC24781.1 hypothetical protein PSET11_01441 [Arthrobacter ulcerisalmonis]
MKIRLAAAAGLMMTTVALTSCAATESPTAPTSAATETNAPEPTQTKATATPTPSSTPSSSETTRMPTASTGETSEPASTVATEKAGKPLALSEFFNVDRDWSEKRYDVADRANINGIASELTTPGASYAKTLELRLANNFNKLTFKVGQSNSSTSSDKIVEVRVIANGKQIEIQKVPFNTIQEISVPVGGVNALKIQVAIDPASSRDNDSVTAVLSSITLD